MTGLGFNLWVLTSKRYIYRVIEPVTDGNGFIQKRDLHIFTPNYKFWTNHVWERWIGTLIPHEWNYLASHRLVDVYPYYKYIAYQTDLQLNFYDRFAMSMFKWFDLDTGTLTHFVT